MERRRDCLKVCPAAVRRSRRNDEQHKSERDVQQVIMFHNVPPYCHHGSYRSPPGSTFKALFLRNEEGVSAEKGDSPEKGCSADKGGV